MKIHEYQAKQILKDYGIPVPNGRVIRVAEEARRFAEEIGGRKVVIKAQIHAGGRGKGGGVKIAFNPEEAERVGREILGMKLETYQTGKISHIVRKILIEEFIDIAEEIYVGITIDRSKASPLVIATRAGGVEIEDVATHSPEKLVKEWIEPWIGFKDFQANKICYKLGLKPNLVEKMKRIISAIYKIFSEKDCLMIEINPLALTKNDEFIAIDAKINFDDNAFFRHSDIASLRDPEEESPLELEASKYNLNYIKLSGNVGCMVNGAGLAMATMDMIKFLGGEPANFLDVGGGATVEMVKNGFKILTADKDVRVVFVNIFGGIMRCDTIAKGIVEALNEVKVELQIVIRLEGTNVKEGRKILYESGRNFIIAENMQEGAEKVIEILNR